MMRVAIRTSFDYFNPRAKINSAADSIFLLIKYLQSFVRISSQNFI